MSKLRACGSSRSAFPTSDQLPRRNPQRQIEPVEELGLFSGSHRHLQGGVHSHIVLTAEGLSNLAELPPYGRAYVRRRHLMFNTQGYAMNVSPVSRAVAHAPRPPPVICTSHHIGHLYWTCSARSTFRYSALLISLIHEYVPQSFARLCTPEYYFLQRSLWVASLQEKSFPQSCVDKQSHLGMLKSTVAISLEVARRRWQATHPPPRVVKPTLPRTPTVYDCSHMEATEEELVAQGGTRDRCIEAGGCQVAQRSVRESRLGEKDRRRKRWDKNTILVKKLALKQAKAKQKLHAARPSTELHTA
ncbi:hypothetical protein B0H13DRAFT_1902994 [Mycena leptocephala]|nr:hypothetical protein B0H13DRAFT_1902994 [Mycena leptocephala]